MDGVEVEPGKIANNYQLHYPEAPAKVECRPVYVCLCKPVTDRQIHRAVAAGARSLRDLRERLGVASGCGRCAACARSCLREALQNLEAGGVSDAACGAYACALPEPT
jgi:bacterioferritin-associated ferredoxin